MQRILCFILPLMFFACNNNKQLGSTKNNEDINAVFNNYWEERMRLFPLEATQIGDYRYNNILPNDISESYRDTLHHFYNNYLTQINRFDRNSLNDNDRISYDIFKRDMEIALESFQYNEHYMPYQQFWGLPLTMGQLGSGTSSQPFKTAQDYRNWLQRVKSFSVWADTAIGNFRKGVAAGIVLPKALVVKMIPQMREMSSTDSAKNIFFDPLRHMPAELASDAALKTEFASTINTYLLPAYKRLGDFLEGEYLAKARTSTGIGALPNGNERYNYWIRYWTTTNKSADEIYTTGLAEVKRIRDEMEKTKNAVGFKGDLAAFFEYMKTDTKFYPYKTPEEVLDAFRAIHKRMEPNLKKMFNTVPKTGFEIRQTEAFRAASASAEYNQGTPDGSRPGIFYVPILDATKFNTTSGMESLFLHEAIPGHHYQISLQQENESLPRFRRFGGNGAYVEGWALYTESLGKELGLYTDPYQYMGALGDEIHRAIRLVVDVGMHTKGMTREEAIKYMMDNEPLSEQGTIAEIERYMAIPGQALSYKIGALKIRELRDKYTKALGDKFKLSDFHDEFLKDGAMPLEVLEKKMDRRFLGK